MAPIDLPRLESGRRFGAHMKTSGGLHNAVTDGRQTGCDLLQVFTKSPQQWRAREITDEQVEQFFQLQEETGIPCVASHDTYLINPCATDPELLEKSRAALADELVRSSRLRIPYVVMHLGTQGDSLEEEAVGRLIDSVKYALDHSPDDGSVLLLETTAGQGKCLGHRFEHLAFVLDAVGGGERLQVCLDTCHIFAAGHDIRDAAAYAETMERFDQVVGLPRIRLIHANDSKKELGSRVDRHAAIGEGCIGEEGFRLLLTDPRLAAVPVILETPKEGDMDPVNLAALRRLAGVAPD